jgi:hypothetical protein
VKREIGLAMKFLLFGAGRDALLQPGGLYDDAETRVGSEATASPAGNSTRAWGGAVNECRRRGRCEIAPADFRLLTWWTGNLERMGQVLQ